MSAVAEKKPEKVVEKPVEVAEPLDPIAAYQMPRPSLGSQILWYPHASRTETPEIAFVLKAGARSIVITTAGGASIDTVRHVDDPKLELNEYQRLNGAWDFPETERILPELQKRVSALEAEIKELKTLLK